MTEREFAYRVKRYLNLGAREIDPAVANRLFIARQNALSRQKTASAGLAFAGIGNFSFGNPLPKVRVVLALLVLGLGVLGATLWSDYERAAEYAEIDSALLADELPINAYLDQGFHAWLEQHSSQP